MSQTITLTAANGHSLSAYSAGPARAAKGLVVVREIFGVNHRMRSVCDRLASRGYAVICPALFDRTERGVELGYTAEDVARGRELRGRIANEGPVADIEAAAATMPDGAKRGIIGFCWGGTIAWLGGDPHHPLRRRVLLLRRRHRGDARGEAALPGTDAFRREGRLESPDRRERQPRRAAGCRDLRLR
jgi:dienelactone hydrolase